MGSSLAFCAAFNWLFAWQDDFFLVNMIKEQILHSNVSPYSLEMRNLP
jgi:hypothetical protein